MATKGKKRSNDKKEKSLEYSLRRLFVFTRLGNEKLSSKEVGKKAKLLLTKKMDPKDFYSKRNLKLQFELISSPLWRKTLRYKLSKNLWEKIREIEKKRTGGKCEICGGVGTDCHERWDYDDERRI